MMLISLLHNTKSTRAMPDLDWAMDDSKYKTQFRFGRASRQAAQHAMPALPHTPPALLHSMQ